MINVLNSFTFIDHFAELYKSKLWNIICMCTNKSYVFLHRNRNLLLLCFVSALPLPPPTNPLSSLKQIASVRRLNPLRGSLTATARPPPTSLFFEDPPEDHGPAKHLFVHQRPSRQVSEWEERGDWFSGDVGGENGDKEEDPCSGYVMSGWRLLFILIGSSWMLERWLHCSVYTLITSCCMLVDNLRGFS